MAALNPRLRPHGSVKLLERTAPAPPAELPKLNLIITEKISPQRDISLDNMEGFMTLEEVIVEDAIIEPLEKRNYGYGPGDRSFSRERLDAFPGASVGVFLQRNLPGATGSQLSSHNYGLNAGDPLLIIDGSRYQGNVFEMLNSFITDEIESIEVYINNSHVFGMAGFAGVIMVETKKLEKTRGNSQNQVLNKSDSCLY